ncbi:glycoside hydrolase family 88/105 protein [Paenibacillus sp. YIM B09110]|uniref:glycoside hydrolase family 88/105 protein n=1 Tax=Paenibacillus sp. YIM B09110 TaxID=3126102 RepID=UPI00301D227D
MGIYVEQRDSSRYWFGNDDHRILELLAGRYIGANPPLPFAWRAFSKAGILQNAEGLYELDFSNRLTSAEEGDYAYAYALVWSDDERSIDSVMQALGPVKLYVNETLQYRSTVVDELNPNSRAIIPLSFEKGWNSLLIEARKTASGFGCRFGADEAKVRILQVLTPFTSREGSAGWVYSEPASTPLFGDRTGQFPEWRKDETASGLEWFPRTQWNEEELRLSPLERLFGKPKRQAAGYGWSSVSVPLSARLLELSGRASGPTQIWVDDVVAGVLDDAGSYQFHVSVTPGTKQIVVKTVNSSAGWSFELHASANGTSLTLQQPVQVHGNPGPWLLAGPVPAEPNLEPAQVRSLATTLEGIDGQVYWSIDAPDARVRPYYENAMLSNKWTTGTATNFGRWDYPLGVTMYGLLQTASELQRADISSYAIRHIEACTEMYDYSMWDFAEYGFPAINHQLVLMKMLDNCGSFGSAMLEADLYQGRAPVRKIADRIADFMLAKLERREDGAFYRLCEGEYSADTMWADDLYMSGPFLTRYALASGDATALNESAKQFLLYKRYLFMEDAGVMSHVFDFKYGKPTRVPWGRGNGWVLFSLTELLERLPGDHPDREALLAMFREHCAGVAKLQAVSGLWRQVLNQPDAYEEASCTAMFVYAFARGLRFGWLDANGPYAEAALKGWQGLTEHAIDRKGNVHGVCSGSRYAFSPIYYMEDLRTVLNDNHGIGIMMLAGVEMMRLKKGLA